MACGKRCEVYSRIVGYFRPVANWNFGKKEEFKDRVAFDNEKAVLAEFGNDNVAELIDEGKEAVKAE